MNLCGSLSDTELAGLNAITSDGAYEPDQTLIWEGEAAETLSIVVEGCVAVYKLLSDGRRQVTGFLFPTDLVGLAADDRYAYTALAIDHVKTCQFPRAGMLDLFARQPDLGRKIFCVASNELAAAQDQILLLGRKTARERLATFIVILFRRMRIQGANRLTLDLPMARPDIADYLGLTVETVSRTFTSLRRDGIIDFEGVKRLVIRNEHGLAEIAMIDDHETLPHAASL